MDQTEITKQLSSEIKSEEKKKVQEWRKKLLEKFENILINMSLIQAKNIGKFAGLINHITNLFRVWNNWERILQSLIIMKRR